MKVKSAQSEWERISLVLKATIDKLGKPIDKGIFEGVLALNALGITTDMSCEGHLSYGTGAPYIDVVAGYRPRYRLNGEEEYQNRLGLDSIPDEQYEAFLEECSPKGKTEEYKVWEHTNYVLMDQVVTLLREFYQTRVAPFDIRIHIEGMWGARFRITNGDPYATGLTPITVELLAQRQAEFHDFTEFLKRKYWNS